MDGAKEKALKGEWAKLTQLDDFALPNLFRKVIEAATRDSAGPSVRKPEARRRAR